MGSGISTKYQIKNSSELHASEKDLEYGSNSNRVFEEEFLNDFFSEELGELKVENASLENNILSNKEVLKFHEDGRFGDFVRNEIDNYYSDNPMKDAMICYKKMAFGGERGLRENNSRAIYSRFADGSFVQFRPISSSPGSPAVELKVQFIDSGRIRKIHFIKRGE